jgi:hypothetical protein
MIKKKKFKLISIVKINNLMNNLNLSTITVSDPVNQVLNLFNIT